MPGQSCRSVSSVENISSHILLQVVELQFFNINGNKALLSSKMSEIEELLKSYPKIHLGFEATVGGGTPILRTIQMYYNTDDIDVVKGIMNGSTNYILSKMLLEGVAYQDVYDEAMKLGYLESTISSPFSTLADPSFDIDGKDARSKLMILNRLAFGVYVM